LITKYFNIDVTWDKNFMNDLRCPNLTWNCVSRNGYNEYIWRKYDETLLEIKIERNWKKIFLSKRSPKIWFFRDLPTSDGSDFHSIYMSESYFFCTICKKKLKVSFNKFEWRILFPIVSWVWGKNFPTTTHREAEISQHQLRLFLSGTVLKKNNGKSV